MTGPTDKATAFSWPVRVYYEDTDCGGIVYHTAYLRYMERARTEWLRQLGFGQESLRRELDRVFAVRSLDINYERPARLDDALTVITRVSRPRRTALYFDQRIVNEAEQALCLAGVTVVCLDAAGLRPRPLPQILAAEIADVG
ncbi:tol-pal system-associated acyl-CoA thioesterase [Arhodomonas sp. AD133]|uniref:tol-pal system-associated acyl-CoA thioesterase n=1 Tax=Arhodomonas sp. AD133 TaxID=3415009 RepID=UPI003EBF4AD8